MPCKVLQLSEICRKCHKPINPEDERAYKEDIGRVCLDCFFDRGDVEMIAEVSMDNNEIQKLQSI
jgi:hypothetical protein